MSSPSPKSFRNRMGSAVRRASSFGFGAPTSRPTTPSLDSADAGSHKQLGSPSRKPSADSGKKSATPSVRSVAPPAIDAPVVKEEPVERPLVIPDVFPRVHSPSPIAESPAREEAATSPIRERLVSSPLAMKDQVTAPSVPEANDPAAEIAPEPKALENSIGAFTDDLEAIKAEFEPVPAPEDITVQSPTHDAPDPGAFTDDLETPKVESAPVKDREAEVKVQEPSSVVPPAQNSEVPSQPKRLGEYFDIRPVDLDTPPLTPVSTFRQNIEENAITASTYGSPEVENDSTPWEAAALRVSAPTPAPPTPAPTPAAALGPDATTVDIFSPREDGGGSHVDKLSIAEPSVKALPRSLSTRTSQSSFSQAMHQNGLVGKSSESQAPSSHVAPPSIQSEYSNGGVSFGGYSNGIMNYPIHASPSSMGHSIPMPMEDPFADPKLEASLHSYDVHSFPNASYEQMPVAEDHTSTSIPQYAPSIAHSVEIPTLGGPLIFGAPTKDDAPASMRNYAPSIAHSVEIPTFGGPLPMFGAPATAIPQPESVLFAPHNKVSVPTLNPKRSKLFGGMKDEGNGSVYEEGGSSPAYSIMPLPAARDVVSERSIRTMASTHSMSSERRDVVTDERLPLIPHPTTPPAAGSSKLPSYILPAASMRSLVPSRRSIAADVDATSWTVGSPRLHELGWLEYVLPDGSVYYVHPTSRVTTDIDLRSEKKLDQVTKYVNEDSIVGGKGKGKGVDQMVGWEVYLRDVAGVKDGFEPVRSWVDHKAMLVSFEPPSGAGSMQGDDRLDREYMYWSFLEAHPAHTMLPTGARNQALDALQWSYTDQLLPSTRGLPPPFKQDECQDLMHLLRSVGDGEPSIVHTRIVSRVLLRVAHWRQLHFRPEKALPGAPLTRPAAPQRSFFARKVLDFTITFLCLGIPYFFINRQRSIDMESGLHHMGSMLMIGASSCLMAAIVLSASVTLLSLPDLDSIARIAGLVATILCSASMVSAVVAIIRYKADMERAISYVGSEGLWIISRRSLMMSLPLVFLAYAVASFTAAIIIYSLRGGVEVSTVGVPGGFSDYTRYTVLGTTGAVIGILFTSFLLT